MNKLLLLGLTLILCACGPQYTTRTEIPPEKAKEAAEFITKLCEVSNPKSDEEPEDMILQAQRTAEELFGVKKSYVLRNDGKGWVEDK